jgi:signal transduction histidine kinase
MAAPLHILLLLDQLDDAERVHHELRLAGVDSGGLEARTGTDSSAGFQLSLALPETDFLQALRSLHERPRLDKQNAQTEQLLLEHTRLLEQVRAGRERAQLLSQQLMDAQEAERRHLARELHDEIGQALTALRINLQTAQGRAAESGPLPELRDSVAIVDQVLKQVRGLSMDLRPAVLDDLGLASALRWHLDRQALLGGFTAEFVSDPADLRAPSRLETACFRVAQEALTNILRHAQAKKVCVEIRQVDLELRLLVRDDGVGFDIAVARQRAHRASCLGLLGMQERVSLLGGRFDLVSSPGAGTEISVRLPLAPLPSVERRSRRREQP